MCPKTGKIMPLKYQMQQIKKLQLKNANKLCGYFKGNNVFHLDSICFKALHVAEALLWLIGPGSSRTWD